MNASSPNSGKCPQCGARLTRQQAYCPNCGQRAGLGRLTLRDMVRDLLQLLLQVDRGVLSLAGALLVRPGVIAREYVNGTRTRYLGPFAFLTIVVGLTSLAILAIGFRFVTTTGTESWFAQAMNRNPNLLFLLQVPFLAAFCRLIFWRGKYNFAEHLALAAYTTGIRTIVVTLVVMPIWYLTRPTVATPQLMVLYWVAWYVYFAWAMAQFQGERKAIAAAGGFLAAAAMHLVTYLIVSGIGQLAG